MELERMWGTIDARPIVFPAVVQDMSSVRADFTAGSGTQTRYERIAGIDATAYYADWTERERGLLSFTTDGW